MSDMAPLLTIENTVKVERLGHRLAMGVQWIDAVSRLPAAGAVHSELEALGARPLPLAFAAHPKSRYSLVWAGRLRKLLSIAAAEKTSSPPATPADDQTSFKLRSYAQLGAAATAYVSGNDPRAYVPRRLALIPVLDNSVPTATAANTRQAWLWPGAAYPLVSNATALRGRVLRDAAPNPAAPQPWARIIVTRPNGAPPNFNLEPRVGWGHGDDRGEFLVVLGFSAVPGGAVLPQTIALRVWVLLPSTDAFDAADPLASLPLEQAGSDTLNDILRGIEPPAGYVVQSAIDVSIRPGEVFVMKATDLTFP